MSSFEWNKIIASVLTALIVAMVAGILSNMLVRPKPLEKPVFVVAGSEAATSAPAAAACREPSSSRLPRCWPRPTRRGASS